MKEMKMGMGYEGEISGGKEGVVEIASTLFIIGFVW